MSPDQPLRILGIDPGSRHTGYGIIDRQGTRLTYVEAGSLSPPRGLDLVRRLHALHAGLAACIARLAPHEVAVEDLFHAVNARTALQLAHVRGVLLLAAAQAGLPVVTYPARKVKQALVGHGGATKEQVAYMIARLLGRSMEGQRSDATDALAVAVCHASHLGTAALRSAGDRVATGGPPSTAGRA